MCFILFEVDVIQDHLFYGILLQVKHGAVWYGLCFYYNIFKEAKSKHFLVVIIIMTTAVDFVLITKRRMESNQLKKIFSKLNALKEEIEEIFTSIPDPIMVVNRALDTIKVNGAAELLCNEQPLVLIEALVQPLNTNMHLDYEFLKDKIFEFIDLNEVTEKSLGISKLGDKIFEIKAKLVTWQDSKAATLIFRDVTMLIQLEQSKHESQMKNVMLRSVSHELRTPANAFQNLVLRVMKLPNLPDKALRLLGLATDSCKHFLHVINDLLDYSQFINGSFRLSKCKFDLRQTIASSFKPFEYMINSSGLSSSLMIDEALPTCCYNDPNRLSQILMNLLSNAVKFTRHGGIRVKAALNSWDSMRISVEDDGVGISIEQQSKLFSLFGKLQENESLNPQGCGLGLHISNLLARQLGGQPIEIESAIGMGSKFWFDVSLNDATECLFSDYTIGIDEEKTAPLQCHVAGSKTLEA
mmetsp:Transcript_16079/g.29470  ORF Transcript_16079/g.29470 Transcript_16079/m.29470 type:complete len:469 (+) Transcript_16079:64-1470(+)